MFNHIKRRPPKAKADPPLSPFFDASHFAPPSKQTNNSERKPNGSQPACGVGERRRHDLVVPLLYPWRERRQSRWRVGQWQIMLVVVCCCVGLWLTVEYPTFTHFVEYSTQPDQTHHQTFPTSSMHHLMFAHEDQGRLNNPHAQWINHR